MNLSFHLFSKAEICANNMINVREWKPFLPVHSSFRHRLELSTGSLYHNSVSQGSMRELRRDEAVGEGQMSRTGKL